ncbi:MAG TPA: sigma-70 family RNA polymerase sigma factor [Burkholderiales bacterium]|nr:sigma-70 family RNA polymerase sigma factor [Burkholderiales bacterium]
MRGLFGVSAQFRAQVEGQREPLYRLGYSWCRDAALADDLVQEAMLRALDRGAQLNDAQRLKAWLCAILANCLKDHYRRARPLDPLDDEMPSGGDSPETASASSQLAARVRAEVGRLPLGQRQVVTLVDLEGFSYAEVGQILEVPIGTVMSRLCRAREALRARLIDFAAGQNNKIRSIR